MSIKIECRLPDDRKVEVQEDTPALEISIKMTNKQIGNNSIAALIAAALKQVGFSNIRLISDNSVEVMQTKVDTAIMVLDGQDSSIKVSMNPQIVINDLT